MIKKLSILIPAYNEASTIHLILNRIKEAELINNIEKEIIIVNDCSTDDTEDVVKNYIADNPCMLTNKIRSGFLLIY
jgi:glycosyltransferase involved in cell wall biosynthesis